MQTSVLDSPGDWQPPRITGGKVRVRYKLPDGGPTPEDVTRRISAWTSPAAWHPEPVNDNTDWPLAKLLRTEKRFAALMVAERYRALYDVATDDSLICGSAYGGELEQGHRTEIEESTGKLVDKGARILTAKVAGDITVKSSGMAPAKKWTGDNRINARIDARRELAVLRGRLGAILDPFELAVVDRATLEKIGNTRGIMSKKGAAGAGRALVDLGLEIAAAHWRMDLAFDGRLSKSA